MAAGGGAQPTFPDSARTAHGAHPTTAELWESPEALGASQPPVGRVIISGLAVPDFHRRTKKKPEAVPRGTPRWGRGGGGGRRRDAPCSTGGAATVHRRRAAARGPHAHQRPAEASLRPPKAHGHRPGDGTRAIRPRAHRRGAPRALASRGKSRQHDCTGALGTRAAAGGRKGVRPEVARSFPHPPIRRNRGSNPPSSRRRVIWRDGPVFCRLQMVPPETAHVRGRRQRLWAPRGRGLGG